MAKNKNIRLVHLQDTVPDSGLMRSIETQEVKYPILVATTDVTFRKMAQSHFFVMVEMFLFKIGSNFFNQRKDTLLIDKVVNKIVSTPNSWPEIIVDVWSSIKYINKFVCDKDDTEALFYNSVSQSRCYDSS